MEYFLNINVQSFYHIVNIVFQRFSNVENDGVNMRYQVV